jgi:hypothetical protein
VRIQKSYENKRENKNLSERSLSLPDGRKGQSGSKERGAGREMNVTLCTGVGGI